MSSLLTPVDLHALEAVTGGASVAQSCSTSSDPLLQTLTTLSNTIKDIGNTANKTGFSTTEVLMLGLLMQQRNPQQVVFVRRPYW